MNILVLSPTLLGEEQTDGGVVSSRSFLQSLAGRHRIFCVAFDGKVDAARAASARREMESWASEVSVVALRLSFGAKVRAKLAELFSLETEAVFFESAAFRAACRKTLADHAIDVVIVCFPQMARYVDLFAGYATIMDTQDVFSVSKFRMIGARRGLVSRAVQTLRWLKWVRFEKRCYSRFDHVLVVSRQDQFGLSLFAPGLKSTVLPRLIAVPGGVRADEAKPFHIGFLGAFSHEANALSVEYLLERIVPALVMRVPDLRVLIAGRNPPPALVERSAPCVHFAGYVESVDEFYSQVSVVTAPLVTGGGIKIKVVEALLSGLPVVTTSVGADGMELVDGVSAMIADDVEGFVRAVARLLANPELRVAMGRAGRAAAMPHSSPEGHARVIDEVFQTVCEGR